MKRIIIAASIALVLTAQQYPRPSNIPGPTASPAPWKCSQHPMEPHSMGLWSAVDRTGLR